MKGTGMADETNETEHVVSYTTYVLTWVALICLTLLLSVVSHYQLGGDRGSSLAALIISPLKASLVVFIFMHLKYEKSGRIKIMLLVTLLILIIFLGLTYLDVAYR
jgi:cytochrome c oxidase subunit 4